MSANIKFNASKFKRSIAQINWLCLGDHGVMGLWSRHTGEIQPLDSAQSLTKSAISAQDRAFFLENADVDTLIRDLRPGERELYASLGTPVPDGWGRVRVELVRGGGLASGLVSPETEARIVGDLEFEARLADRMAANPAGARQHVEALGL
jgi:hypothetical protein